MHFLTASAWLVRDDIGFFFFFLFFLFPLNFIGVVSENLPVSSITNKEERLSLAKLVVSSSFLNLKKDTRQFLFEMERTTVQKKKM